MRAVSALNILDKLMYIYNILMSAETALSILIVYHEYKVINRVNIIKRSCIERNDYFNVLNKV